MSVFLVLMACGGRAVWWGPELAEDLDPADDVVEVHLRAEEATAAWGVGTETAVWSYNGSVPGPTIRASVGDTLRVVFDNALPDADTTIHWHGMRVPNAMDGTAWVQDPVGPGEAFTYSFVIPDAGTYWYHPHLMSNEAVERGLYGAIVIDDPDDAQVDLERLLVLDDVDLQPDGVIAPFDLDESLINTTRGRLGNTLLVNGQPIGEGPLVDHGRAGEVERWRLVNAANARTFDISVDGAAWRLIAEDGQPIDAPRSPGLVTLASGQRADLEVLPGDDDVTLTLWIRVPEGADIPISAFRVELDRSGSAASPLDWRPPTLPEVEATEQTVDLLLDGDDDGSAMTWTINGAAWMSCDDMLGGDPISVRQDAPTSLRLVNASEEEHPFHLHGQFMLEQERNGEAPPWSGLRDTVLLMPGDDVTLYARFENPGLWMAHCHILEHSARGMMTAFEVAP